MVLMEPQLEFRHGIAGEEEEEKLKLKRKRLLEERKAKLRARMAKKDNSGGGGGGGASSIPTPSGTAKRAAHNKRSNRSQEGEREGKAPRLKKPEQAQAEHDVLSGKMIISSLHKLTI